MICPTDVDYSLAANAKLTIDVAHGLCNRHCGPYCSDDESHNPNICLPLFS